MGLAGAAAAVGAAATVAGTASNIFGGSNASVQQQGAQSSISPYQSDIQSVLQQILGNNPDYTKFAGQQNPGQYTGQNSGTQFAAQLTPQQLAIINSMTGNFINPNSGTNIADQQALTALGGQLNAKPLDWTGAYNAIAQPLQQTFQNQTLPGIKAALATSAGGVNSGGNVGLPAAIGQATQNLTNAEGNAASTLAYQSSQANSQNILQALGLVPSVTAAQGAQGNQALTAAGLPQATQQQQLSGQYTDYQTQLNAFLNALGLGNQFAGTGTQTPGNTIVSPGQSSPLGGYLGGLASNSNFTNAIGSGLGSLFQTRPNVDPASSAGVQYGNALSDFYSDKRLKRDIRRVGRLRDGTNIYRYRYKGPDPSEHIGVIAQEIERKYPSAVTKDAEGMRKVDYSEIIKRVATKAA